MSPGLPSTLSRILKPLLWASLISPASAVAPGAQRSWRLTHTIPAVFILSGAEKSLTWPPNSQAPLPAGGGGGGAVVGWGGGGLFEPPSVPGMVNCSPTKIRFRLLMPLAAASDDRLTPKRLAILNKVSPRWTIYTVSARAGPADGSSSARVNNTIRILRIRFDVL